MENHIEKRFMDPDATLVFNQTKIAKAIHEEAHAGACGADQLRQSFLRDWRNQVAWCIRITECG